MRWIGSAALSCGAVHWQPAGLVPERSAKLFWVIAQSCGRSFFVRTSRASGMAVICLGKSAVPRSLAFGWFVTERSGLFWVVAQPCGGGLFRSTSSAKAVGGDGLGQSAVPSVPGVSGSFITERNAQVVLVIAQPLVVQVFFV